MINSRFTQESKLSKAFELLFLNIDYLLQRNKHAFDTSLSGTTLTLVFVILDRVYCASVGDSRCVLIGKNGHSFAGEELSWDHKPTDPLESQRIISRGGKLEPNRGDFNRHER